MGYRINNKNLFRHFIFRLGAPLAKRNVTAFLTSESQNGSTPFGVEDFISDGILSLRQEKSEQSTMRYISIPKMRGVNYRSGEVNFDIKSSGIKIYPKVHIDRNYAATDYQKRLSSGIDKFDEMLNGGFPEGHIILITGNSGTGKTTFGMQFLLDGINKNEKVLFVNLEEPKQQIIKTAEAHGWDFEDYEEKGLLKFITPDLIDTYPDKLLDNIVEAIEKTGASRLFFDSVSSLPSANFSIDEARQMMLQLNSALKKRGVTALMTYLESGLFNAGSGSLLGSTQASELRLSSLSDGIILLRYIEDKDKVGKILNILKMRGTAHNKEIHKFDITDHGIDIGEIVEKKGSSK